MAALGNGGSAAENDVAAVLLETDGTFSIIENTSPGQDTSFVGSR